LLALALLIKQDGVGKGGVRSSGCLVLHSDHQAILVGGTWHLHEVQAVTWNTGIRWN